MSEKKPGVEKYQDIINLPHHVSKKHPQMSIDRRAAQFSPFAALTGYEDVIIDKARITEPKRILGEDHKAQLDKKFGQLLESIPDREITVLFFQEDLVRTGEGTYITHIGVIKKIDTYNRNITFMDSTLISLDNIYDIYW